jgi:hypothetical protein
VTRVSLAIGKERTTLDRPTIWWPYQPDRRPPRLGLVDGYCHDRKTRRRRNPSIARAATVAAVFGAKPPRNLSRLRVSSWRSHCWEYSVANGIPRMLGPAFPLTIQGYYLLQRYGVPVSRRRHAYKHRHTGIDRYTVSGYCNQGERTRATTTHTTVRSEYQSQPTRWQAGGSRRDGNRIRRSTVLD